MNLIKPLAILPFQPENQAEVKALILAGLVDHWGWLDESKNPDLNDIASSYAQGVFLVAWCDGHIVGTGGIVPRSNHVAEVVRMSVAVGMRRQGVGRQVLQALMHQARARGFSRLVLETTATWQEVIAFYLQFGFEITHHEDDEVHFALEI